jgi:hypothetical protein
MNRTHSTQKETNTSKTIVLKELDERESSQKIILQRVIIVLSGYIFD